MDKAAIDNLKARILSMADAIKAAPNAHNIAILNAACADLRKATGEVYSCGEFIKVEQTAAELAVAKLMRFINSHGNPAIDNGDGTLTVTSEVVDVAGIVSTVRDIIPATLSAARDLLGY
ncbi:hypothetical protein RSP822_18085 [Ralstonia solanacearum]|uniref:hypothetical protein n=1 Tax=Ralstonia solanacearum TaxID=305 RepID=UPI000E666CA2|nr:hypothetical protein [Ralstonia solanacearum]RIJ84980.1 hypothetical protein RSP822_18085 [Ralstonia solanacearum]